MVVLLLEAVVVPLAILVVAVDPDAVTDGDADALALEAVVTVESPAVVVAEDCADAKGSRRHSTEKRKV